MGILSSVIISSLGTARAKARDALRISNMRQLSVAVNNYYLEKGKMPTVYAGGGPEICEKLVGNTQYSQFMQDLITGGFLSNTLSVQETKTWPRGVCYYDYGKGHEIGAILVTHLETKTSTNGIPPSCRPFPSTNWCSNTENAYYCLCIPY